MTIEKYDPRLIGYNGQLPLHTMPDERMPRHSISGMSGLYKNRRTVVNYRSRVGFFSLTFPTCKPQWRASSGSTSHEFCLGGVEISFFWL